MAFAGSGRKGPSLGRAKSGVPLAKSVSVSRAPAPLPPHCSRAGATGDAAGAFPRRPHTTASSTANMKATVFIATSLDGFIARDDGNLDWLHAAGSSPDGEDYGYRAFMKTVDALVMGRHTYETVLGFDKWPYDKPVFVLATRPVEVPASVRGAVELTSGEPAELLARLASRGIEHVYVDGGRTVQRFLEAGAIQRLIITRIPVLIGRGIPLFGPVSRDIHLRHVDTRHYRNGLVQSEYIVTD